MASTICQKDPKPRGANREEKEAITNGTSQDEGGLGPEVLHQYQGFWFVSERIEVIKEVQESFQACDTDLILATLPKSGTLWLKSLAFATVNRTRYGCSPKQRRPLLSTSPHDLVPFIEFKYSYEPNCSPDHFTKFESPRLLAAHIPYPCLAESIKTTNCKIVYLCRNPKDNLISMWTFIHKLRESRNIIEDPLPIEKALDFFCNGVSLFGPFWDHVLGYWKASLERPEKVLFLKYVDLKKDPNSQLKRLCGVPGSSFFNKDEVGDWKNHLTLEMAERLDRLIEEKLQGSGLSFSY